MAKTSPKDLPGGITEAQLKQWKARWGDVYLVEIPMDEGSKNQKAAGYFKKPNLETISAAAKFEQSDPIKSGMIVFENCLLHADEALQSDDVLKLSCVREISKLIQIRQGELKKL